MRLLGDDEIVSMDVVKPGADLLVLHERGYGKRVALEEYRITGRYVQGVWTTDHTRLDEVGPIIAARVVYPDDHVTVITANGIILRTPVSGISQFGRGARGVRVVNLLPGDSVAALAVLTHEDLTREVDGGSQDGEVAEAAANGEASNGFETMAVVDQLPDQFEDGYEQDGDADE